MIRISRPLRRLSQYTAPNIPTITPSVTIYSSQYPDHYTVRHNIQLPISRPLHRLSQYTVPNIPTITPSVTIYSSQYPDHYTVCHNIQLPSFSAFHDIGHHLSMFISKSLIMAF